MSLFEKEKKHRRSFEEELTRLKSNKDRLVLPRLSTAMWPGDVKFLTDISDSAHYNRQYIENHFVAEATVSDSYVISTWHTAALTATIAGCFSIGEFSFFMLIGEFFALFLLIPFLLAIKMPGGRIRFNRQAQIVHFFMEKDLYQYLGEMLMR